MEFDLPQKFSTEISSNFILLREYGRSIHQRDFIRSIRPKTGFSRFPMPFNPKRRSKRLRFRDFRMVDFFKVSQRSGYFKHAHLQFRHNKRNVQHDTSAVDSRPNRRVRLVRRSRDHRIMGLRSAQYETL